MKKLVLVFATLAAAATFVVPSAKAEAEYPWCAQYGRFGTEATNCGFSTRQQCLATISGIGGYCVRNPRYQGRVKAPRR
jgi:hypothetical protein